MPIRAHQASFTGGELAPSLYSRTDLTKYGTGLRTCLNFLIQAHGGASTRPGMQFISEVKDSSKAARLIPFAFSTTQTYCLEFGNLTMRVIKDGGAVLETAMAITAATKANPVVVTAAAHGYSNGDDVYISGVVGMTQLNGQTFKVANKSANTFELTTLAGSNVNGTAYGTYASGGTTARVYTLVTPYAEADLFRLGYSQSADTLYLVHPSYAPRKLTRTGHAAWTLSAITFAPAIVAPAGLAVTPTGTGGTAETLSYVVTSISTTTGEESLASSTGTATGWTSSTWPAAAYTTATWSAVTGATQYKVYKQDGNGSLYGFIGTTEGLTFKDDNISPDVATTPPSGRNPFNAAGDYPSTVSFHEQRLWYGATNNNPQTLYGSVIGAYDNMSVSRPAKDDQAVTFTIASTQVNEIRHIVPLKEMILLTSGGEWKVSGAKEGTITPSSILVRPQSYRGSSRARPIVVGETVLYVQDKGSVVRDLAYKLEVDGFTGTDLSILANHLFAGHTVVEWAYAQVPYSIAWGVRDDGVLLGFTYLREHEVWAWHRHTTDGTFESVAVVSEGSEDAVYAVVKRTIGGVTKRYIERMHTRHFTAAEDHFGVDSGLTYSGTATATITGLDHLEGKTVSVFANGDVLTPVTVSGGAITLPRAYTKVHAGLPYTCDLETLNIDAGATPRGTIQGRKKSIAKVVMRVDASREFSVGPDSSRLTQTKMNQDLWDAPISAYSGDVEVFLSPTWNSNGRVFVRQSTPAPLTVLSIMPEVEFGG